MTGEGFVHSVKVPALYKSAAKIVEQVLEQGGSIKQLLYTTVNKSKLKGVYALITKTIEHNAVIEAVLEKVKILKENPRLNVYLAKILVAELVVGKQRLQGESKPVQTILTYHKAIEEAYQKEKVKSKCSSDVLKPRYARVNTLRASCDEVIKQLRGDGWQLVPLRPDENYAEWLKIVRDLTEEQFVKDLHVKDLLVFPPGTEFFNYPLYQDGTIILQDKASCLPALVLAPPPNTTVLDMCAAPGMKTTLLSGLMRGKGVVYAVEQNDRRVETLRAMVGNAGCLNVEIIHGDSLALAQDWVSQVQMILVDPSCSGTGMTERAKLFNRENDTERIRKLSAFQFRLLMHALTAFPSANRVVYSTCSILPQENEEVVASVLAKLTDKRWQIASVMPNWPHRGSTDYPFGADCLTARPAEDLTTGFFIALFERNDVSSEQDETIKTLKKRKRKKYDKAEEYAPGSNEIVGKIEMNSQGKVEDEILKNFTDMVDTNHAQTDAQLKERKIYNTVEGDNSKKINRKKRSAEELLAGSNILSNKMESDGDTNTVKYKKNKKEVKEFEDGSDAVNTVNPNNESYTNTKKKKKRKRSVETEGSGNANIGSDLDNFPNKVEQEYVSEVTTKKKKNKRKDTDRSQGASEIDVVIPKKKEKKKKRLSSSE